MAVGSSIEACDTIMDMRHTKAALAQCFSHTCHAAGILFQECRTRPVSEFRTFEACDVSVQHVNLATNKAL